MKRASYRDAVDWIAQNDSVRDNGYDEGGTVSELVSSQLVADIFDVEPLKVGADVVARRKKLGLI